MDKRCILSSISARYWNTGCGFFGVFWRLFFLTFYQSLWPASSEDSTLCSGAVCLGVFMAVRSAFALFRRWVIMVINVFWWTCDWADLTAVNTQLPNKLHQSTECCPLKIPATETGETSGRTTFRTRPKSPKSPQQPLDPGHESLREYTDG